MGGSLKFQEIRKSGLDIQPTAVIINDSMKLFDQVGTQYAIYLHGTIALESNIHIVHIHHVEVEAFQRYFPNGNIGFGLR